MNLFNFKKMAWVAGVLSVALYAQQALAWDDPYLYCTKQNPGAGEWRWAQTDGKQLNKDLNIVNIGYNEGNYLRLQGHYLSGHEEALDPLSGTFFINARPKDGTILNEEQARSVCNEVQSFCPGTDRKNDYIYPGAARYSTSDRHQIGLYFKYDPSNSAEQNSILICPSYKYRVTKDPRGRETEVLYDLSCGRIYGPVYYDKYGVGRRDERDARLGPACQ